MFADRDHKYYKVQRTGKSLREQRNDTNQTG